MKAPFTAAFQPIFKSAAYRPFPRNDGGAGCSERHA